MSKISARATLDPKRRIGAKSPMRDMCFSPTSKWTPAPGAVHVSESYDDISPTSSVVSSDSFSYDTPRQTKQPSKPFFFSPATNRNAMVPASQLELQHGYMVTDCKPRRKQTVTVAVFMALFWIWGAWSWRSFQEKSQDPIPLVAPPNSPSAMAKEAFAKLYKRDWGADPSLWIMLDASTTKRINLIRDKNPEDSHSFTDDTSAAYEEGKQFCCDLAEHLKEKFQHNGTASVRLTNYYSLQEEGLDYIARHFVTPDGSKTIVQIEFIQKEMGIKGIQNLKESILEFSRQNQPSYLDTHFTGLYWYGSLHKEYSITVCFWLSLWLSLAGVLIHHIFGIRNRALQWGVMTSASLATALSGSAILMTHVVTIPCTPTTLSAIVALSLLLSLHFSKLQVDKRNKETKEVHATIVHCSCVQQSMFIGTFFCIPSLQNVSAAAAAVSLCQVCFHRLVADYVLPGGTVALQPALNQPTNQPQTGQKPRISSVITLCASFPFLLFLALQARRLNVSLPQALLLDPLDDAARSQFRSIGESMGHGRLTPYRILFDGHKRNQTVVSLNGYDIMQMVVDELRGISLSETDTSEKLEELSELSAGSTHVGESYSEVQHLIRDVVRHLKRLRTEQQEEFDLYHKQRHEHWQLQQDQEESDIEDFRCDYNLNKVTAYSGIAMLENLRIPQSLYNAANICRSMEPRCPSEALHLLNVFEDETTTPDRLATFVDVNLAVDPFSKKGQKWLELARNTVQRLQADPRILGGVEIHIAGAAAEYHDSQADHHENLLQLLIVASVTLLTLAISLRSATTPIWSLATHGTALVVTLGLAVLIYQDGVLNWTHIAAFESAEEAEQSSYLPIVCFLATALVLTSEITWQRGHKQSSMTNLALVSLFLLAILIWCSVISAGGLSHWPLLVVINLFADGLIQSLVKTSLAIDLFGYTKSPGQGNSLHFTSDEHEKQKQNEAFLQKFEELLKSPHAP